MVTSYALVVPLSAGEEARRLVASRGIGRADLKLGRRADALLIPIRERIDPPLPGARVEVLEFETLVRTGGSYKDVLRLAPELQAQLPTAFDIIGDLVLIKIPDGLLPQRYEVARAVLPGERVFDATAGVGPFAVLAAKAQPTAHVLAVDLNPSAVDLLRENLMLNKVQDRVEAFEGDARILAAGLAPFHRAIVNLPRDGEPILESVWAAIAPAGMVHFYAVMDESTVEERIQSLLERLGRVTGRAGVLVGSHVVHPYSPRDRLYAFDLRVR